MLRWCRYYFLVNPLINAVTYKMAEYPITPMVVDEEDSEVRGKWEDIIENQLKLRTFQIETGLDYFAYGNAFITIHFPFEKFLSCLNCKFLVKIQKAAYKFRNLRYFLVCSKCGVTTEAEVKDIYIKSLKGIKLIRWNPEYVNLEHNDITGETAYFFEIPMTLRNDVMMGKRHIIETIPDIFVKSLRETKSLRYTNENVFHLKRPIIAQKDMGWGMPIILPVLKDCYYLQILRKAQEAIANAHIVPLRVLFPQAGNATSDPYCVSPSTLIETIDGLKPASEVKVGDYLRSHKGYWRKVEGVKARDVETNEKVYKLRVSYLTAFESEFSEEHPIFAVKRYSDRSPRKNLTDPEFIQIRDLKKGDYIAYPTNRVTREAPTIDLADYLVERAHTDNFTYRTMAKEVAVIYEWLEENHNPTFTKGKREELFNKMGWSENDFLSAKAARKWDKIDRVPRYLRVDEHLATLIGYYLAEGYTTNKLVGFGLHINEKWVSEEISDAVLALGFNGTADREIPEQNSRTTTIQDVLLSELISGLCGKGFLNKRFPQIIVESENSILLAALRALFIGDGCSFKTDTNRVALKLSNPSLILEARRLLLSFGILGGISKEIFDETDISKADAYHLNYNGSNAEALRVLFSTQRVLTSKEKPEQRLSVFRDGYVYLPIDEIKETEIVKTVIGFQMSTDKSFCVAGVATHNTLTDLSLWRRRIEAEIQKWRMDCVSPDTVVETKKGLCKAKDISIGMYLKNHLGQYSKVEALWNRPLREHEKAYKIKAEGLEAIDSVFSENHPLFVSKRIKNNELELPEFIKVKDVSIGDYVGYPIDKTAKNQIPRVLKYGNWLNGKYKTASIQLAEDVRQLLLSSLIPAKIDYDSISNEYVITIQEQGIFKDGYFWHRIDEISAVDIDEVIGIQTDQQSCSVTMKDDSQLHGTFCTWGMAGANSNYIPILPLPIGNEVIGGEGKSLMLHQEMRAWSEQIVAGMHVPIEFVFGGLAYSGSNVSMRMLENQFLGYRTDQLIMCRDFILGRISDYLEIPRPKIHFKRFKMADDLQRAALVFQMNQAMKISDTTLLDEVDIDIIQEEKNKASELNKQLENQRKMQLAQASLQGEMQVVAARYQVQAQRIASEGGMGGMLQPGGKQQREPIPGMPEGSTVYAKSGEQAPTEGVPMEMQSPLNANQKAGGYNLLYLARRATTELEKMDDATRYVQLAKMKGENPSLYSLTLQLISSGKGSQADNLNPLQSPIPEKKPPRRQMSLV